MDNEEIERVMNFIIERQEIFAQDMAAAQADTRELKQSVADLTERVADLTENVAELTRNVADLNERVTHITNVVGELVDAQQGFLQGQERMQSDISNMLKITTGLFEIVVRNGGATPQGDATP